MGGDGLALSPSVVMLTPDRQIDRRILLEADSLEAVGWHVTILAMPLDVVTADEDPRVVRIATGVVATSRSGFILNIYQRLCNHLPMNGNLMRLMKAFAWRLLADQETFHLNLFAETAFRYSPTVFLAHDLPMLPVARQAAERCGARLVYDSHELYSEQSFSGREKRRWAEIEGKHIGACDAVVTINPSIARELEQRYGLHDVKVVYNAERSAHSPERQWKFHETFGLDRKCKVLLFQGGLSAGRHIEVLVDAMRLVDDSLHLVIMGDGHLKARLRGMIERLRLSHSVHLHPAVSQKALIGFTASADAGIIPYQATCLNNYYCTPNKLFEYISAGLPILANDLPEIRRIISAHQIGMVGDFGTPEKVALFIAEFFGDAERLQRWRTNTLEARKVISWEHEAEKVVSIFETFR